ncbi:hypothetical protein [Tumebacillus lipolyticus]|uniref:Uncharacterized protein n=1 Tax=Tumebacillus lipolyticus TaxID=1280370 RepID=A0ABW4ZUJ4_9BACL
MGNNDFFANYLLTDRLVAMLLLSMLFGVLSAVLGYYLAAALNASIAGAMVSVAGLQFLLIILFSPRDGLVARRWLS